jgi:superfamily II DNA or RNA helicase
MSRLTRDGYAVPRSAGPGLDDVLDEIRAKYTVRATAPPIGPPPPAFRVYRVGERFVYIPKHEGLRTRGLPETVSINEGAPIDVAFEGSLRPEQARAKDAFLEAARDPMRRGGVLNLNTGAGKTVVALKIVAELGRKALVVVHKKFLMDQWAERIAQFLPGARVGRVQGSERTDGDVVICMLQTLCVPGKYTANDFADFGVTVVDECHHVGAEVFSRALYTANSLVSLGLSATVRRKDGLSRVFHWHIGDVLYASPVARDSNVHVRIVRFAHASRDYSRDRASVSAVSAVPALVTQVCEFEPRTRAIADAVVEAMRARPNSKTLVLSDRRNHLETIRGMLAGSGFTAGLYVGGMKPGDLKASETRDVLLGTYGMCSEGFDVPELDLLVLASPKSDIVQSVGRILRVKPEDRPRPPLVVDIVDELDAFRNQARRRRAHYKKMGYAVQEDKGEDGSGRR